MKGRVIDHTHNICLDHAEFVVRESGRQRVLKQKQKNVHAFVRGVMRPSSSSNDNRLGNATYNPYLYSSFVDSKTKEPIYKADSVILTNNVTPQIIYFGSVQ